MFTPSSLRRADFPAYLWEPKAFPFIVIPLWRMQKSVPSTVIVQLLSMLCTPNLLPKTIWCVCGGGGSRGVRTGYKQKKVIFEPHFLYVS